MSTSARTSKAGRDVSVGQAVFTDYPFSINAFKEKGDTYDSNLEKILIGHKHLSNLLESRFNEIINQIKKETQFVPKVKILESGEQVFNNFSLFDVWGNYSVCISKLLNVLSRLDKQLTDYERLWTIYYIKSRYEFIIKTEEEHDDKIHEKLKMRLSRSKSREDISNIINQIPLIESKYKKTLLKEILEEKASEWKKRSANSFLNMKPGIDYLEILKREHEKHSGTLTFNSELASKSTIRYDGELPSELGLLLKEGIINTINFIKANIKLSMDYSEISEEKYGKYNALVFNSGPVSKSTIRWTWLAWMGFMSGCDFSVKLANRETFVESDGELLSKQGLLLKETITNAINSIGAIPSNVVDVISYVINVTSFENAMNVVSSQVDTVTNAISKISFENAMNVVSSQVDTVTNVIINVEDTIFYIRDVEGSWGVIDLWVEIITNVNAVLAVGVTSWLGVRVLFWAGACMLPLINSILIDLLSLIEAYPVRWVEKGRGWTSMWIKEKLSSYVYKYYCGKDYLVCGYHRYYSNYLSLVKFIDEWCNKFEGTKVGKKVLIGLDLVRRQVEKIEELILDKIASLVHKCWLKLCDGVECILDSKIARLLSMVDHYESWDHLILSDKELELSQEERTKASYCTWRTNRRNKMTKRAKIFYLNSNTGDFIHVATSPTEWLRFIIIPTLRYLGFKVPNQIHLQWFEFWLSIFPLTYNITHKSAWCVIWIIAMSSLEISSGLMSPSTLASVMFMHTLLLALQCDRKNEKKNGEKNKKLKKAELKNY